MNKIKINNVILNENNVSAIEPIQKTDKDEEGEKVITYGLRVAGNIEPRHYEHWFESKKARDKWLSEFEKNPTEAPPE